MQLLKKLFRLFVMLRGISFYLWTHLEVSSAYFNIDRNYKLQKDIMVNWEFI